MGTPPINPERLAQLDDYAQRRSQDPAKALDEVLSIFFQLESLITRGANPGTGERVDFNTQYTQSYMELRRYRDYELTAAGWFGALQIGLATVLSRLPAWLLCALRARPVAYVVLIAFVLLLGLSGVLSVGYANARYEQLKGRVSSHFGDAYDWTNLPKAYRVAQPFFWVVVVLSVLPVAQLGLLELLLGWPCKCFLIISFLSMLCIAFGVKYCFRNRPALSLDP